MPARKAAGRVIRLYSACPFLLRRLRLPVRNPPLARPRENGGSPLSAGVSPPQIGKACASYRSSPSRMAKAQGQYAGKREMDNVERETLIGM